MIYMKKYVLSNDIADLSFHYNHGPWAEMHTHNFWEILLVTNGMINHKINGLSRELKKNTLCLIRPEDSHGIYASPYFDSSHVNIRIKEPFLKEQLDLIDKSLYIELKASEYLETEAPPNFSQYTLGIVHKLQTLKNSDSFYKRFLSLLFLDQLRIILYDFTDKSNAKKRYVEAVQELIEIMYDIKNINLSIEEICGLSHYSHSYLIKLFKKHLNTTPSVYFQNIKMNYARNLLETTMLSATQIAVQIGFTNIAHFNTAFKKAYGNPPGQYRKKWNIYYNSFTTLPKTDKPS